MRFRWVFPALALVLACTPARRDEDDDTGTPDAGSSPACETDADCGVHGSCAQGSCGCIAGFHACGGSCLSDDAAASCGTRCSPCPAPADGHGEAICENRTCGVRCGAGELFCGGSCIVCAGTCVDGACHAECGNGLHRCGNRCVGDSDVAACGASCTPCVPPTGSGLVPSCAGGSCGFACAGAATTCRGTCSTGTCTWRKTALQQTGTKLALTTSASGTLYLGWARDDGWGYLLDVDSGSQPSISDLCDNSGEPAIGVTPRGPALMCAQGNYQAPMHLDELVNGTVTRNEIDRAVTSARGLQVNGDVLAWISDSHVYRYEFANGAWQGGDSRVVDHENIRELSLLRDAAGRPQLVFSEYSWSALEYRVVVVARGVDGKWTERIAGKGVPFGAKFRLLPDGSIAAAWLGSSPAEAHAVVLYGEEKSQFLGEVAAREINGSDGDAFDFAVDPAGTPRIAFARATDLGYALRAGGTWMTETVGAGNFRVVRLVLQAGGAPVIATLSYGRDPLFLFR